MLTRRSSVTLGLAALLALMTAAPLATPARADEVPVAVAANFTQPAKDIAASFQAVTGHTAVLSFGASGQFYTQITQGAPFEVFLSADNERPKKAVDEGFGVSGSVFTYAVGKLVLWSKTPGVSASEAALKQGKFAKLSIANPKAAPYGVAALETIAALGLTEAIKPKLVEGNNITQAWQFVDTGNAELGFVALSQVIGKTEGSSWVVPEKLYQPILQDAVLLKTGADKPAAAAFLAFLKGPQARAIIEKYGYGIAK